MPTIQYSPAGTPSNYTYANGLATSLTFNNRLETTAVTAGSLLTLANNWGTTNNNGNLRGQTITAGATAFSQSFSYDGVNRLSAAAETGGWSRSYGYDAFGNNCIFSTATGGSVSPGFPVCTSAGLPPTSSSSTTKTWYTPSNQLTSGSSPVCGQAGSYYDCAGNVTQVPLGSGAAQVYDAESRITTVTGSGTTNYAYDADGHRVAKQSSTNIIYVYDAVGTLAAQYSSGSRVTPPCTSCYLTADHLGSTRLVTSQAGTVVGRHDYLPFGNEAGSGVNGRTSLWGASDTASQKFTGKLRDSETYFDYFGARYYGSALGRFTSPDPLLNSGRPWNPQSWNRYAYALNNTLRVIDPTGLYDWDTTLGGDCSDKALNSGNCEGYTKSKGKDITAERKSIRAELRRLAESKDASLRAVGYAIGTEGQDNGVTISMGNVTPGAAAQVSNTAPLTLDKNGNPMLDLRVLPGAKGDPLFVGLAHEGSHIWDAQSVARGDRPFVMHLETELSGYLETITAAKALGWSSVGPQGGTPLWSSSWSAVDQQARPPQEIMKLLLTSPIYAPTNGDVAYTLDK